MALPKNLNDRKYWTYFQDNVAYTNDAGTTVAIGTFVGGQYNLAAPTYADGDPAVMQFTSDGKLKTDATFSVEGDISIGGVEIKNATDDTRAVVKTDGTNNALVVVMNTPSLASAYMNARLTDGTDTATITAGGYLNVSALLETGTNTIGSVKITDGAETLQIATDGVAVKTRGIMVMGTDGTLAQTISVASDGDVNIADGGNVITVDGSGTAGTAAGGVLTIQGVASMTSLIVSQATAANLNCTEASASTISAAVATPTTLTGGSETVDVVGTAQVIGTTLATKSIYIRAKSTNTSFICVGDSAVDESTNQEIVLYANDSVTIDIANRVTVYIDADVINEGVDYLCMS